MWYCPNCGETTDTKIVEKEETLCVKGLPLTLMASVRICSKCRCEITDEDLDSKTLKRFYSKYDEVTSPSHRKELL